MKVIQHSVQIQLDHRKHIYTLTFRLDARDMKYHVEVYTQGKLLSSWTSKGNPNKSTAKRILKRELQNKLTF